MTEFLELLKIAQRRSLLVVALTLVGALIAAALNLIIPVSYVASARLFVATPNWNDSTAIPGQSGVQKDPAYGDEFSQMRIASYQRMATSPAVTLPVIEKLHLDMTPSELADAISCRAVPDTVMLDLLVRDGSAARSAAIANAAAEQLGAYVGQLERPSYSAVSPIQPVVIQPAATPQTPSSPRVIWNIANGACIGLLVGITLAFFLEARARGRVLTRQAGVGGGDAADWTLGVLSIGEAEEGADQPTEAIDLDEDARFFRLQVETAMSDVDTATLMLTSPRSSSAAWRTAVTLATALDEAGSTAVVVLADFELQIDGDSGRGLGDVLAERGEIEGVVRRDPTGRLGFVPPGTAPASPFAAYADRAIDAAIARLRELFDIVIFVGPAVLESAAAVDLAGKLGASLLVLPSRTGDEDVADSERLLRMSPTPVLGRVVTVDVIASGMRASPDAKTK